mmetsp:Transcript_64877/g.141373  ORF Transcript_64877/g.141373 Transcript_64877/m.141373 type:complete len:83 (-) Transcript_64877:100-348(-)
MPCEKIVLDVDATPPSSPSGSEHEPANDAASVSNVSWTPRIKPGELQWDEDEFYGRGKFEVAARTAKTPPPEKNHEEEEDSG